MARNVLFLDNHPIFASFFLFAYRTKYKNWIFRWWNNHHHTEIQRDCTLDGVRWVAAIHLSLVDSVTLFDMYWSMFQRAWVIFLPNPLDSVPVRWVSHVLFWVKNDELSVINNQVNLCWWQKSTDTRFGLKYQMRWPVTVNTESN